MRSTSPPIRRRGTRERRGRSRSRTRQAHRASSTWVTRVRSPSAGAGVWQSAATAPTRRAGSAIGVEPPARSGSMRKEPAPLRDCRCRMEIHAGRCGSASGFSSWPITRASVTATPVPTMEATSGGTRTKTSTTCAFRQRMARASSIRPAPRSRSTTSRPTPRAKWRSKRIRRCPRPPAASKRRRSRSSTSRRAPTERSLP